MDFWKKATTAAEATVEFERGARMKKKKKKKNGENEPVEAPEVGAMPTQSSGVDVAGGTVPTQQPFDLTSAPGYGNPYPPQNSYPFTSAPSQNFDVTSSQHPNYQTPYYHQPQAQNYPSQQGYYRQPIYQPNSSPPVDPQQYQPHTPQQQQWAQQPLNYGQPPQAPDPYSPPDSGRSISYGYNQGNGPSSSPIPFPSFQTFPSSPPPEWGISNDGMFPTSRPSPPSQILRAQTFAQPAPSDWPTGPTPSFGSIRAQTYHVSSSEVQMCPRHPSQQLNVSTCIEVGNASIVSPLSQSRQHVKKEISRWSRSTLSGSSVA
ncbi:hypothetical protein P154DRAFT_563984 [Amniculicola lignicola CBS 123094]|uniref:Uncharacterized protein n=1 Tax=Amniculicola lignicola CBS 123094 TaxID=1392246 RepID=A0A6A5WC48_9PLEO|nr:hypothetical protein P154DRAFT_563984 [Amniculicola lignicola CBS 123094]